MPHHLSRRRFLQSTTTLAAAAFAAPAILARDKSGLINPILGEGDHTYECIHDWGQLPLSIAYGNTHGVCEDAQGNIYIKHTVHATSSKADAIVVFDPDGKFIRSWGAEYKGGAHGLHLSREKDGEFLYLCDQARGIVDKTTLTGEKVWTKTAPLESGLYNDQKEYHPTNIAIVPSGPRVGEFFIADGYGKSWVHHYNAKAEYLTSWGGPGSERGQLNCPHGLMIDTRHTIRLPESPLPEGGAGVGLKDSRQPRPDVPAKPLDYAELPYEPNAPATPPLLVIADRANHRLQYFTLDGRHVAFVKDNLKLPCHFHTKGDLLLVPDLDARVTLLDKNNKLITHLGDGANSALRDKPRDQFLPGKFIAPHSAIFDRAGNIFVVEWVEVGRVTKLRKV